jgi:ATP-dependent DNA ligase
VSRKILPADVARSVTDRPSAEPADLPRWIKPQLTKLVDEPPEGSEGLHEIKFDRYRMHARLDRGTVQLPTRTGLDWTHKCCRRRSKFQPSAPRRKLLRRCFQR